MINEAINISQEYIMFLLDIIKKNDLIIYLVKHHSYNSLNIAKKEVYIETANFMENENIFLINKDNLNNFDINFFVNKNSPYQIESRLNFPIKFEISNAEVLYDILYQSYKYANEKKEKTNNKDYLKLPKILSWGTFGLGFFDLKKICDVFFENNEFDSINIYYYNQFIKDIDAKMLRNAWLKNENGIEKVKQIVEIYEKNKIHNVIYPIIKKIVYKDVELDLDFYSTSVYLINLFKENDDYLNEYKIKIPQLNIGALLFKEKNIISFLNKVEHDYCEIFKFPVYSLHHFGKLPVINETIKKIEYIFEYLNNGKILPLKIKKIKIDDKNSDSFIIHVYNSDCKFNREKFINLFLNMLECKGNMKDGFLLNEFEKILLKYSLDDKLVENKEIIKTNKI